MWERCPQRKLMRRQVAGAEMSEKCGGTHNAHDDVSGQGAQLPDGCADAVRHAAILGGEQL